MLTELRSEPLISNNQHLRSAGPKLRRVPRPSSSRRTIKSSWSNWQPHNNLRMSFSLSSITLSTRSNSWSNARNFRKQDPSRRIIAARDFYFQICCSKRSDTPRHLRLPDTFPSGTGAGQVCAVQVRVSIYGIRLFGRYRFLTSSQCPSGE